MADETAGAQETTYESAKPWHDKLKDYRVAIEDKWEKQRENLDKLYSREERADSADREYAIFWANIEVLKPATYARTPTPVVAPRFKQPNPVASQASEVLERSLVTTFEQSDVDGCLREVRDEFLRYARGTAWARLSTPDGTERVEFDHVTACDFAHDPARTWREVKWAGRRHWLTRQQGSERFDEALAKHGKSFAEVPLKKRDENSATVKPDDKAPVWEIWDKDGKCVVWVNEEFDCVLDKVEPFLDLSSFWPCPAPAYGTLSPGKLKPVPDIRQYKDQIEEINEYTARIASLSESLRLRGFYPAGSGEVADAIEAALKSMDNRQLLVPISSWASLGGIAPKDLIIWVPVDLVLQTITGLVELRRVLIDDVYQITGISDIVRGDTDPKETKGAQVLKSQWGSMRIRERVNEMARFARDLTRIAAEIQAENFQPQTLQAMSQVNLPSMQQKQQAQMAMQQPQLPGAPPPPPPAPEMVEMLKKPSFDEVMKFLRDDKARGFTIEIETDSTIQPDEDAEKNRRIEFVTAIGTLMKEALPVVQVFPPAAMLVGEVMKFTAQGFRAGRPLEGAIDQFVSQMESMLAQPQQAQPDPKAEADKAKAEAEVARLPLEEKKLVGELQLQAADLALKQKQLEQDDMTAQADMAIKARTAEADINLKNAEGQQAMAIRQREADEGSALKHREFEANEGRKNEDHQRKASHDEAAFQSGERRKDALAANESQARIKGEGDIRERESSERMKRSSGRKIRVSGRDKDGRATGYDVN